LSLVKRAAYYSQVWEGLLNDIGQSNFRFMVEHLNLILSEMVTHYLKDRSE